jgi:hypothetical protein
MSDVFSWLFSGLGALLFMAVLVAGWEHLSRQAAQREPAAGGAARAARIDLRLDTQSSGLASELPTESTATADAPPTERQSRLVALADALARAARPGLLQQERGHWMDTAPRIVDLKEPVLGPREPVRAGSGEVLQGDSHDSPLKRGRSAHR